MIHGHRIIQIGAQSFTGRKTMCRVSLYHKLYNIQINARALIDQSAMVYCAAKPTEKPHLF